MFVGGTKIHTGGGGVLIQLARWTLPRVLTFVNAPFCRFQMNSIDWNQFHTPQEAIEYCEAPVLPTWKVFEFGIFAFSIGQLTMSSETHSVEDAGAVPLTLESVEAEANRQRMEAAGKKRVAEKSQAEEQGEKKEKVMVCVNWIVAFLPKVRLSRMFVGLILGLCLSIAFCELQAETMRFAIKFEPSAVQFSWYELECQLREILGEARVQQGLEEGTFGVTCLRPDAAEILGAFASRNQAVLTDLGSECERPASAVTFVTMRAHLGGLPLEAKEEEVRQWLREANPSAQCLLGQACSPAGCMACVCDMLGGTAPHPGDLPGQAHSSDRSGEDRPLRADHRLVFIRAAGVEWPQQMQEYLKNHHIVVEVSDIWRSEVAWSSGRWDGTFCVMATPEQREAIDALKRESPPLLSNCGWMVCRLGVVAALGGDCPQVGVVCLADVSLSPGWTECFASEVGPMEDPSGMLLMRHVLWERKLLGMWPLILLRLVKGSLVIVLSFPGMGLMGAPMPASAQNLRMNGQLWTTSEGLVVTLGPVKGSTVKPGPP
ncbi:hypothetical protein PAPYR_11067 [Paratrimastix pyriformis]|uniref:Uncharacterized protein n=1 Tax=Paratrimastix pyriformis TaxID=342808 RepID=A0ABQ8U4K8_9EUKA|nr:hypothetical protein PAPYR_11067 [Paratrimastix pyriformis]